MICEHCGQEISRLLVKKVEIEKVIEIGASYFNVKVEKLKSKDRYRENVYARQMIMSILSRETRLKLREIGEIFNRDHTTVIYAKETIRNLAKVYPEVSNDIKLITESIYKQSA